MENLTLYNVDEQLKESLQKRAVSHGCSVEEEAITILRHVLLNIPETPINLGEAIQKRFADCESFELPEIPREMIRTPPSFDE